MTQCRKNPSGNECPKGLSSGLSKLHNKNVKDVVSIFVRWVRCKHNSIVIGVIDVWYNTTINISRCSHMCNDCHIMKAVKRIFFFVFLLQDFIKNTVWMFNRSANKCQYQIESVEAISDANFVASSRIVWCRWWRGGAYQLKQSCFVSNWTEIRFGVSFCILNDKIKEEMGTTIGPTSKLMFLYKLQFPHW